MKQLRAVRIEGSAMLEALESASEEMAVLLEAQGADAAALYAARVAMEELGTNILKYAYAEGVPPWLEMRLSVGEREYALEVEDGGLPFNPLEHPEPDTTLPLEKRGIGGLGVFLVRKMMERVEYERLEAGEGRNRVTAWRRLAG